MFETMTPHDWNADLDFLESSIERDHCDPWHTIPRSAFRRAARRLREHIPNLTPQEIIVEFARLVAMIGDGHTALHLTRVANFHRFPLSIYRFSDGLFVRASASPHEPARGARLLAIAGIPAEEAFERLRAVVSCDNAMGIWQQVPELMSIPEVLHARGIIRSCQQATFHVETPTAVRFDLPLAAEDKLAGGMVANGESVKALMPLWLRDTSHNWAAWLSDDRAVYLAFNAVRDDAEETAASLFDRAFGLVREHQAAQFILDLRQNSGGNKSLNEPLVRHIIRCDAINQPGRLFVIIGRKTFSAAMNLAVDLERLTNALFVGEPTGASPNHFGENATVNLPQSGLHLTLSTLWWQNSEPYDDRPWIEPDIPARLRVADYFVHIDPAMEAIRDYETPPEHQDPPLVRLARKLRRNDLI